MYRVHNGGFLFDGSEWIPLVDPEKWPGRLNHLDLEWFVTEEVAEGTDIMPGPRTLRVVTASHRMILYDMDDWPGRLLYLQIVADNTLVPLCRSLRSFVECQVELAKQGYIALDELGPRFGLGPGRFGLWPDEFIEGFVEICYDHGVCPAYQLGTDVWLKRPEADTFSIG